MNKVLITGGRGFIGIHLSRKFEDSVIVDLKDGLDCCSYLPEGSFPRVYYLASFASPPLYIKYPLDTFFTNTVGLFKYLNKFGRLLFASSSEVYGDPEVSPIPESYTGNVHTIGPRACYDEGKRSGEMLCSLFPDTRIVRIFNTYGPGMSDDGRVVVRFIKSALKGEPLVIYGDGLQTRSFCYIDDMVDGLIKVMESDCSEPVNLGNPEEITILGLALEIIKLVGKGETQHILPLTHDPKRRCPDITKAKSLGWVPKVSLEEGLKRTIEYFKEGE